MRKSGHSLSLTIGSDNITGTTGDDTVNAGVIADGTGTLQDALQSIDQIDGGAGNDTLVVTLNGGVATVTPALKSVETVNLRVTKDGGAIDFAASTGVTNVNVTNTAFNTGTIKNVKLASLGINNSSLTAAQTVEFDNSTATTLALSLDTNGNTTQTSLVEMVVDLAKTTAAKASTLSVTTNNTNAEIKATTAGAVKTVNIAATGTNILKLSDAAGTATALAVTGAGSVDISGAALTKATTATAGNGGLTADFTGGVLATATTGTGKDKLTVDGSIANLNVNTGAGDDTIVVAAGTAAGGMTLTAGDGVDALSLNDADYATVSTFSAANAAKITGFETLSVQDAKAGGGTYDLSLISGGLKNLVLEAGTVTASATTVNGMTSGGTLTLKGDLDAAKGTETVNITNALTNTADVLNVLINSSKANTAQAVGVTAANVETINVTASTTATADTSVFTTTITDDALKALTIAGNQSVKYVSDATQTKLATIDASTATAAATIDLTAVVGTSVALTVTGSAKADTFTIGSKASVTGGAGADTFTLVAASSGQTYSTIADASTGDIIKTATLLTGSKTALSLAPTSVFQDYLDAAAAGNASHKAYWFQWSGDTYIVQDEGATSTFTNGTDVIVKLAGVVDLSKATWDDADHTITIA